MSYTTASERMSHVAWLEVRFEQTASDASVMTEERPPPDAKGPRERKQLGSMLCSPWRQSVMRQCVRTSTSAVRSGLRSERVVKFSVTVYGSRASSN